MKYYEILYIVHPALEGGHLQDITKSIDEVLEKNGVKIKVQDNWGRKKLAYPIEKQNYGTYVLTQFESAGMVKKHHFEGSHAVYEVIEEHHEHMVDVETGKVLEFQDIELMDKINKIANDAGYQLVDHNLVLHVKKK